MNEFGFRGNLYFPKQKVSASEKRKAEWYANCIDFVIAAGVSFKNEVDTHNRINILHGNIPDEFYRKTLNPYNSSEERYRRFPATMRNFDIMSDIVRRYVGEYTKGIHEFTVGSNDPNIIINKNAKLKEEVTRLCQQAFVAEFTKRLQQMQQEQQAQAQQGGEQGSSTGEQNVSSEQVMSPEEMEAFVKNFNENYIDEQTVQGQQLLEYIQSITKDEETYTEAFFNFIAFGECYTYKTIRDNNVFKENIPIVEAYPIPTRDRYVEDHDMFARKMMMSLNQIYDMFDDYLSKEDREFLDTFYARDSGTAGTKLLSYDQYFEKYPDVCSKFNEEERNGFRNQPITVYEDNGDLYEVWHVVWRGFAKRGILTYINEMGMQTQMIVDEDFEFNTELGHINIEWVYEPQTYEGYRIGSRYSAIYPIHCRPCNYNRNGKLPYNGLMEVLPLFGKFSIVDIITPFQVLRNIIAYHREMVIAKNKMLILIMPESLLGDQEEDKVYKMAADGVLYYDDSLDSNSIKAQQIRLLNANLGDYIKQLTDLMEAIKVEAREVVDMTPQRYGMIAQSAGKGTTEEAIARGSMGSVIINFAFDKLRATDYQGDLDNSKLAFVDGLDAGYYNNEKEHKFISLDVDMLLMSDLSVIVKNSATESEKLEQLRQWAFSAAQNGDLDMALAAITGNSVSAMKKTIMDFQNIKRQHEEQMQQAEQLLKQEEIENKLREIAAKGEEDRKTEELKYYYELQLKYAEVDMSVLTDTDTSVQDKNASQERIEEGRREIERMKLDIERQKMANDMYNAAADRNVQREQMENDLKIARTNKNKYDNK